MPTPRWRQWELEVASDTEGSITVGSGNQWYSKSDVRTEKYRISCKDTEKNSFSITRSDWREIDRISAQDNKIPVLAINISGVKLALISWDSFINGYV